jgi:hypothetical protein
VAVNDPCGEHLHGCQVYRDVSWPPNGV